MASEKYWTVQKMLEEAERLGLRRALFVTALECELQAVRGHLKHIASCRGRDKTIYECGIFSDAGQSWLIVAAEAGAGTHQTQNLVTNAHVDFGTFEALMFVGVGGSRKPDDAPLGSVVASEKVYYPYPGKYGDQGRSARPEAFRADPMLVELAKKVRRDGSWVLRISDPYDGKLPASPDYPFKDKPIGRVAPIVSTEAVSANPDSELEALIARECGDAYVVEMEGYGAVYAAYRESTPAIIIRGISDLAKDKKPGEDKQRQPVASCHAAAFAFEILAEMNLAYPRETPPPPPTSAPAHDSESARDVSKEPNGEPKSRRTVLNLDGEHDDISPERLAAIEATLRALTGDPNLKISRTDKGSVRLVVDDPSGALDNIDFDELKKALEASEAMQLLGRVPEDELALLATIQSDLGRASADLLSWPSTLAGGEHLERPELDLLLSKLRNSSGSVTVVLGLPGSGKSSLLATLGNLLLEQGHPILAIKADLLNTDVRTESDIATQFGLDEAPSRLLLRLARLRPVYLIIDQLDALAGYLDIRTGRLSALLNLVRFLGDHENIHIVLSARIFEFEHDVRLRSISAENLQLELPGWSQVLPILEARNINATGWPDHAKELMRTPQALATYLQLQAADTSEPLVRYQAMLDRLWSERVLVGENGPQRSRVASDIADQMAEEESLWLARARFDDHHSDIEALIAAGILTPFSSGLSIGFAHQTVFDYALSRGFAQAKGRLSSYVLERQASLFVRPKLWAALTYLREAEPSAYQTDIEAMWNAQGLRRHLQLLLIDFLGQQVEPSDQEARLMERAFKSTTERMLAFKAIIGSPGWFRRLKDTFISQAMTESEESAGFVTNLLSVAWRFAPEEVEELLVSKWSEQDNDLHAWTVLDDAPVWTERLGEFGARIVNRTQIAPIFIDRMVAQLGVEQPDQALALLRARLNGELSAAQRAARERASIAKPKFKDVSDEVGWLFQNNPKEPLKRLVESNGEWDSVPSLAEKAPKEFLGAIWPWFQDFLDALREFVDELPDRPRYSLSDHVDYRFEGETRIELREPAILEAIRVAAEGVAAKDPDFFRLWVAANADVNAMPVQRMIAHAMATQPEAYAADAFDYLMADRRRLWLAGHEKWAGTSARLVNAVSEHWSEEQLAQFETYVRGFVPAPPADISDAKGKRSWTKLFRQIRLILLRALPTHRISQVSKRLIIEEGRALPDDDWGVRFSGPHFIGSVMEAEAMARASDNDILNAFRELPDATGWDHPRDWERGGNIQLSRAFASFAKDNPSRARTLIAKFDKGIGERAAGYALESMSEGGDANAVAQLFLDLNARGFESPEFRNSASLAMQRVLDETLPLAEEVAEVLEGWLASREPNSDEARAEADDPDEETSEAIDTEESKESTTTRSLLWGYGGFSSVPQGDYMALEALVHLRLRQKNPNRLLPLLVSHLDRSIEEPVWRHLLRHLIYLHPPEGEDGSDRISLFEAIFDKFPALVGTRDAAYLLAHVHWWADKFVAGQLIRWKSIDRVAAQQGYGELVGLIALTRPELDWAKGALLEIETSDSLASARAGVTLSAANLWNDGKHQSSATALITRLLATGEAGVWIAAADLFRIVDELAPNENTSALLEAMANGVGSMPQLDMMFIVERLQSLLPHEAELIARIMEGLVGRYRDEIGDIRTGNSASAHEIVNIAITLHRLGPATREAGTRLFETLIEIDAYSARQTMAEIDSRFLSAGAAQRPRLPRRRPKQGRGEGTRRRRG